MRFLKRLATSRVKGRTMVHDLKDLFEMHAREEVVLLLIVLKGFGGKEFDD